MKITKRQLRKMIREMLVLGQQGIPDAPPSGPLTIIVDWDDDGAGIDPRVELHPDAVADYYAIAAEEGEEAADMAVTEMLTDEMGWLVNGWEWE